MSLLPPTLPLYHEKFPYTISLQWRKIFSFVLSLRVSFSANWTYCSRFFFLPEIIPRIFPVRSRSSAWTKQCRDQRMWRCFRFTKKSRWVCLTLLGSLSPWSGLSASRVWRWDEWQSTEWTISDKASWRQWKRQEKLCWWCENFVQRIAMNPFQQETLKKLNNSKISFPEKSVDILKSMETKGEQDVFAFISNSTSS